MAHGQRRQDVLRLVVVSLTKLGMCLQMVRLQSEVRCPSVVSSGFPAHLFALLVRMTGPGLKPPDVVSRHARIRVKSGIVFLPAVTHMDLFDLPLVT